VGLVRGVGATSASLPHCRSRRSPLILLRDRFVIGGGVRSAACKRDKGSYAEVLIWPLSAWIPPARCTLSVEQGPQSWQAVAVARAVAHLRGVWPLVGVPFGVGRGRRRRRAARSNPWSIKAVDLGRSLALRGADDLVYAIFQGAAAVSGSSSDHMRAGVRPAKASAGTAPSRNTFILMVF